MQRSTRSPELAGPVCPRVCSSPPAVPVTVKERRPHVSGSPGFPVCPEPPSGEPAGPPATATGSQAPRPRLRPRVRGPSRGGSVALLALSEASMRVQQR